MRPVNLIPPDERRGDSAPLRTGSLIYVLVGSLAVLLLGIVVVALTSAQINDRKAQKADLQQELQQATARANSLAAFASFRAVQEQRTATVTNLAQSRYDWQRVLHELALVLPDDVTISTLTGTVSSEVEVGEASGGDLRDSIEGPALEISGCAPGQDAVAGFVSALEDIDGVSRVGLDSSQIGSADNATSGSDTGCNAGPRTANFELVVALHPVETPSTATTAPSIPSAVTSGSGTNSSQTASDGISDGQSEQAVARASARAQISKADKATQLIPGG